MPLNISHSHIPAYSLFFASLGTLQVFIGVFILLAGRLYKISDLSILVAAMSIILFVLSRASLLPTIIEPEHPDPLGIFVKIMEGSYLIMLTAMLTIKPMKQLRIRRDLDGMTILYVSSVVMIGIIIGELGFAILAPLSRDSSNEHLLRNTHFNYPETRSLEQALVSLSVLFPLHRLDRAACRNTYKV